MSVWINGVLVSNFRLNPLVVTLAVGTIMMGAAIWYREGIAQEARVPPILADWGETRFLSINFSVWVAMALVLLSTFLLRFTLYGRRFTAVGANPIAAWISGIGVNRYRVAAYAAAGLLYGIAGILLAAFIRNPTLDVGAAYLLAPIAAAVLGGTAIGGGVGSMIAVAGAALFLTHLGQILKMMGLTTAIQFMVYGGAIAVGMALAGVRFSAPARCVGAAAGPRCRTRCRVAVGCLCRGRGSGIYRTYARSTRSREQDQPAITINDTQQREKRT